MTSGNYLIYKPIKAVKIKSITPKKTAKMTTTTKTVRVLDINSFRLGQVTFLNSLHASLK